MCAMAPLPYGSGMPAAVGVGEAAGFASQRVSRKLAVVERVSISRQRISKVMGETR
jgi:hypothetical protein